MLGKSLHVDVGFHIIKDTHTAGFVLISDMLTIIDDFFSSEDFYAISRDVD